MRRWWVIALVLAWGLAAWGQSFEGDAPAKDGRYELAEQAYVRQLNATTDPATRLLLTSRRHSLAQLRNDYGLAERLASELERVPNLDPRIELRLRLVQGGMAYRTYQPARASKAFQRAEQLAGQVGGSAGALARYECLSYQATSSFEGKGRDLSLEEYNVAGQRAVQASQNPLPSPQDPLWPMDVLRSLYWDRMWIFQANQIGFQYMLKNSTSADMWYNLGVTFNKFSITALNQAAQATQDPEYTTALMHMILEYTEDWPLAQDTGQLLEKLKDPFRQSLPDNPEWVHMQARYHRSLARYYWYHGQHAQSLPEFDQASELFAQARRPQDRIDALSEQAYHCYIEKDRPLAVGLEPKLRLAVNESNRIGYDLGRYYAYGFLGQLKADQGQLEEAETALRAALEQRNIWISEARAGSLAREIFVNRPESLLFSDSLVEVLMKRGRTKEALEAAQQLGAQAEMTGVDLASVQARNPSTTRALRDVVKYREEAATIKQQLQAAQSQGDAQSAARLQQLSDKNRQDFQQTVLALRKSDPDFERLISVRPSGFAKLQPQLPPDVLLVEFFPAADKLYLFAVSKERLQTYTVPVSRAELESRVRAARSALIAGQPVDEPLRQLYSTLIAPMEADLATKKTLAVIPSGVLYYVPFAALKKGDSYLCDRLAVVIETASEVFDMTGPGEAARPAVLLAFADPDGSLPGAQTEVSQVASLFGKSQTYVGPQASKERVASPGDAAIVHLATHGSLDSRDSNESYLLMANNGHLKTGEIYGLNFQKVSLVTLSACQTALGDRQPGAEVASLAQAFSIAGSRSVLASLWKVHDQATCVLMKEFYQNLVAGKGKAEALRLAQARLAHDPQLSSPFYWAAFELIGDWR